MREVIIDSDTSKYQPQFYLTQLNEDVCINKFNKVYILIDDVYAFNKVDKFKNENTVQIIYLITSDVVLDNANVKKVNYVKKNISLVERIIKHDYIRGYVCKKNLK